MYNMYNILFLESYDCNGKPTNACGLAGLVRLHSIELLILITNANNASVKKFGTNHIYLWAYVPFTNCT